MLTTKIISCSPSQCAAVGLLYLLGAAQENRAHTEQSKQRWSHIKQRRGLEGVARTKVMRRRAKEKNPMND